MCAVHHLSQSFAMEGMIRWINISLCCDDKVNHVATRFLAMPVCNTATAEKLSDALKDVMEEYQLPRKNVVCCASDTANVMVGAHKPR